VGTTAATVAANLRTAILANQPALSVTDNANGTLSIANKWLGAGGNGSNSKSSSSGVLAVTNFTGGADGTASSSSVSATTTQKVWKAENRAFRIDRVMLESPAGVSADASNYWIFQVLTDSSQVGPSWSTQTSAQGALTADTPADMVLNATDANNVLADGKVMSMKAVKTGSPAALGPVAFMIEGRYI
jgi:hypothetical protein